MLRQKSVSRRDGWEANQEVSSTCKSGSFHRRREVSPLVHMCLLGDPLLTRLYGQARTSPIRVRGASVSRREEGTRRGRQKEESFPPLLSGKERNAQLTIHVECQYTRRQFRDHENSTSPRFFFIRVWRRPSELSQISVVQTKEARKARHSFCWDLHERRLCVWERQIDLHDLSRQPRTPTTKHEERETWRTDPLQARGQRKEEGRKQEEEEERGRAREAKEGLEKDGIVG